MCFTCCLTFPDFFFLRILVRFGEHKISDPHDSIIEDIPIDKTIIHENYNNAKKINDIALVRLARDVEITGDTYHVNTICLPVNETQDIDNLEGEFLKLTIAGWGKTENSEFKSDVLMKAVIDYLSQDKCAKKYEELRNRPESLIKIIIDESHLCAGGNLNVDT